MAAAARGRASDHAGGARGAVADAGPVLAAVQEARVHPIDDVSEDVQDRGLCGHQGERGRPQGHAPQVLPRPHRPRLERHQARYRRRDQQAGIVATRSHLNLIPFSFHSLLSLVLYLSIDGVFNL